MGQLSLRSKLRLLKLASLPCRRWRASPNIFPKTMKFGVPSGNCNTGPGVANHPVLPISGAQFAFRGIIRLGGLGAGLFPPQATYRYLVATTNGSGAEGVFLCVSLVLCFFWRGHHLHQVWAGRAWGGGGGRANSVCCCRIFPINATPILLSVYHKNSSYPGLVRQSEASKCYREG